MKKAIEVTVMQKFKLYPTIISLTVTLLTAVGGSLLTAVGAPTFNALQKVPFQPPGVVFGIAWSVIYLLTFLSAAFYFSAYAPPEDKKGKTDAVAAVLYLLMAFFNILWVATVFVLGEPTVGVFIILAYIFTVVLGICRTYKTVRLSAYLLIPHLAWLLFALVLNYYLALIN